MHRVESSGLINKPIKEVFEYTASPANGHAFIPNLSRNTNITPELTGEGQTFDWHFNMGGIELQGKAKVTEYKYPIQVKIESTGDTTSTWIYYFEEVENTTKVTVAIEYEVADNMLRKFTNKLVMEKLNQKVAEQIIDNLQTILEN